MEPVVSDPITPPPLPVEPADGPPAPARRTGMLCPYCGHFSASRQECDRCRGVFEPLSRQASQNNMGPWFIRDQANPFRPGCSYQVLRALVVRKRIVPESVVRGPSTRQFWTFAKNTPGVAHLLGECHACHKQVRASDDACPHCQASFAAEDDRQYLGLAEMRAIPGQGGRTAARPRAVPEHPRAAPRDFDHAANSIALSADGADASTPAGDSALASPPAYEPIRHPSRPVRDGAPMSDEQIAALLRRSGAAERAKRSSMVVVVLIFAAVLAVALIVVFAIIVFTGAARTAARTAAGGTGTPPGPSAAP